jgi:hypothetical protein
MLATAILCSCNKNSALVSFMKGATEDIKIF